MKKINKNIFIIAIIFAIISILLVQIDIITITQKLNDGNNEATELMNKYDFDGEVKDPEGYAITITKGLGIATQISSSIVLLFLTGMNIIFILNIILYLVFYLISWLIVRKKENKSRVIVSIVLNVIAIIIQTIIMYILCNISIGKNATDALVIASGIVQAISIISIIILYIFNIKDIKNVLNKKNGEKA